MSYQGIGYSYIMPKRSGLMGVRQAISEGFSDPNNFPKELLKSVGLPANYGKMSLHAFMT